MIEVEAAVIVLDLDDTLYLERDFARSGFTAVAQRFAHRFDADEFARYCSTALDEGTRGNIFDLALRKFGVEPSADLVAQLVKTYRGHTPDITLCPDAERFLGRMGAAVSALISDGPEPTQRAKVEALGLSERIDHVFLTGAWPQGYGKPHPRAFEAVQQCSNRKPQEHIYIADNGAKDFLAPGRLGWKTIQILREGRVHDGSPPTPKHAADAVISSLDEIAITVPTQAA